MGDDKNNVIPENSFFNTFNNLPGLGNKPDENYIPGGSELSQPPQEEYLPWKRTAIPDTVFGELAAIRQRFDAFVNIFTW